MQHIKELFELVEKLECIYETANCDEFEKPLNALITTINDIKPSFSGSWQGYHSKVYYENFDSPPPGAHFSQEWGLMDTIVSLGTRGRWREYDSDTVKEYLFDAAGNPNLEASKKIADDAVECFDTYHSELLSILLNELECNPDSYIEKLKEKLTELGPVTSFQVANDISPKGQVMTRDTVVLGQGTQIPPHIELLSEVRSLQNNVGICKAAADISKKAASHLERKSKRSKADSRIGTNVFIGHGQSPVWRDLKDFVQDRLNLPWDEFNRVPVAGVANIARLSEMLDAAAIAFLIMTAEDEQVSGEIFARQNVVHEAGLFQGRLGFAKAIVLLEDGCEEFSNIQGLGQIRFPKGNVGAVFEEIRRVLERESLID